ncbi:DUF5681 domain-containing protein [uncultured Sphingomonas sp.]|uniref:DUF5681 domain-containing protein n=1 Tax=uncultured Sphingomonas sp. TaxID=158754 RepID=UPI0025EB8C3E|nr:DUF5681 domain-containing protein [uncultured Sphingomonas sp.]
MSDQEDPKPFKDTRFKPKQSGNPKGRPRNSRRAAVPSQLMKDIIKAGEEKVTVTISGKQTIVTMNEALIRALQKHALAGKVYAMKAWFDLLRDALQENVIREPVFRLVDDMAIHLRARGLDPSNDPMLDAVAKRSRKPD